MTPWSRVSQSPRGTTLVAGTGVATAFWDGLLRGLVLGLPRGPRSTSMAGGCR